MPDIAQIWNSVHDRTQSDQGQQSSCAIEYAKQAGKLAQLRKSKEDDNSGSTQAVEAKFVTPSDPVIETEDGRRLPTVPVAEALKLNELKDKVEGRDPQSPPRSVTREGKDGSAHGIRPLRTHAPKKDGKTDATLQDTSPPSRTNPLFPPLPMYGPPSLLRALQCWFFRASSAVLSFCFLLFIIGGGITGAVPKMLAHIRRRAMLRGSDRPFYEEEMKRRQERRAADREWVNRERGGTSTPSSETVMQQDDEFVPTEGGPDPFCIDVAYYARRVGLDAEIFEVQTEDGFIIELWHVFNPREYEPTSPSAHQANTPNIFQTRPGHSRFGRSQPLKDGQKKYPVLMMHGLLQSAGAFCCNDDDSLAFYLAKSGYDVWLGNYRCGFEPKHTSLHYGDPRMWAWNIRHMGVMDLPALISRVFAETGFPKLALVAHSQGTTLTFVALAKEQRPDIGEKISVFCALAPAAYAGPLVDKVYFKFMRLISPAIFRMVFGIHSFIPLMMGTHKALPSKIYGWVGYHVFSFLFSWSDRLWERDLRSRMFQWAPVYVSAESMRWWLGRECFAKHRCILSTREEGRLEDKEDEEDDEVIRKIYIDHEPHVPERRKLQRNLSSFQGQKTTALTHQHKDSMRSTYAWYDSQFPPLALWVCGADGLVDGRRLMRRFDREREPHVRVVHQKILEGYEHLDVIWAMDAIEKVGKEVREVIWRTVDSTGQAQCRVPVGCERALEEDPGPYDVPMLYSGGRQRMASIHETKPPNLVAVPSRQQPDESSPKAQEKRERQEGEDDM